jgi:hypothetical protein
MNIIIVYDMKRLIMFQNFLMPVIDRALIFGLKTEKFYFF